MSTGISAISLGELLAYDEHEVTRWHEWFRRQPAEILDLKTEIASAGDLRTLLLHVFGVQLRYAEWLNDDKRTDAINLPHDTVEELFAIGTRSRALLAQFVAKTTPEDLAVVLTYERGNFKMSATKRKCFLQSVLHGDRHWAQVAVLVREAGYKTDWIHDFIMTPAMQ